MNTRNQSLTQLLLSTLLISAIGCSTDVKKADISDSADPRQEITKLESDLARAAQSNVDVLAPDEYKDSQKWLKEAKTDLNDKESQEEIINDLRKGRGYLEEAQSLSTARAQKAPGVYQARSDAMSAGVAKYSELRSDLKSADEDLSEIAENIATVDNEKIAELQAEYVSLERQAVILTNLGKAQAIVTNAEEEGAKKRAPKTFKKAELSLKNAETTISTNVRNPSGYQAEVLAANTDATLLGDVIKVIEQNGNKLSEPAAIKIVSQNNKIKSLNSELSSTNSELSNTQADLENKDSDLKSAEASIATQKAMESARNQFSADEAEAYQQGDQLLIRLKKMNFASGRSDLPEASLAVLAKVSSIANEMKATQIQVEGHTDSVGTSTQNSRLSEKRAESVATYFKTNGFEDVKAQGFGFQKPIASNKSKAGRAQNRRVDIILTPNAVTTEPTSSVQ